MINDHNTCLTSKVSNVKSQQQKQGDATNKKTKTEFKNEPSPQPVVQQIDLTPSSKVYTINDSLLAGINKSFDFDTYEDYLKVAQKFSPIICKTAVRHHLPFCAHSVSEYYSWPYAKRKANEWMRSVSVKRKVTSMINKSSVNKDKLTPWSVKKILIWLRANGYTPLEYDSMQIAYPSLSEKEVNERESKYRYVSSLSPFDELINRDSIRFDQTDSGELIDVISCDDSSNGNSLEKRNHNPIGKNVKNEVNSNYDYLIEPTEGGKHVKEQLDVVNE